MEIRKEAPRPSAPKLQEKAVDRGKQQRIRLRGHDAVGAGMDGHVLRFDLRIKPLVRFDTLCH